MLWIKRLMLFISLLVIVFGYLLYNKISAERQYQQVAQHALVTAQVWIATAKYRHEPDRFIAYRDSLLKAHNLSRERVENYFSLYKNKPEKYHTFTTMVNKYVDSLYAIEMELLQADSTTEGDSIRVIK